MAAAPPPGQAQDLWPARRRALKQMHVNCVMSEDEAIRDLADSIEAVLNKIDEVQAKPPAEQLKLVLECDRLMFQVQGNGVLAYLKSLNALRNTIAEKAAKAPAGSEQKKKLELAQAAHDEVLTHMSAAYEALRQGDKEAFENAQRKLFSLQQPLKDLAERT